jgi:hypothetical protein
MWAAAAVPGWMHGISGHWLGISRNPVALLLLVGVWERFFKTRM